MDKFLPDNIFLIATTTGIVLGSLLSFIFGSVALPTTIPFEFTIGGISTNLIIVNLLVTVLVGAIVFLGYVAAIVKDTAFPARKPLLFLIETVVVAFLPASVIYLMTDIRTNGKLDFKELNMNFLLLAAKFGIFHLLFQFSGVYSYFF